MQTVSSEPMTIFSQAIFQHKSRPEWGRAIVAWERGNRRGYQFEDGAMRTFKQGYYHLFQAVSGSPELTKLAMGLRRRAIVEANASSGRTTTKKNPPRTFGEQLTIFQRLFEAGFAGEAWTKKYRGTEGRKRLKRYRNSAIADARETLARAPMEALLESGDFAGVLAAAVRVLSATDLTTKKQLSAIRDVQEVHVENVARALVQLLHGEDDFELRFERWLRALLAANGEVGWTVTTVLPALMEPEQHICIRPSVFRRQVEATSSTEGWPSTPSALRYARLQTIARGLGETLQGAGFEPRDLFDVYDFVSVTRRPAAGKHLKNDTGTDSDGERAAA